MKLFSIWCFLIADDGEIGRITNFFATTSNRWYRRFRHLVKNCLLEKRHRYFIQLLCQEVVLLLDVAVQILLFRIASSFFACYVSREIWSDNNRTFSSSRRVRNFGQKAALQTTVNCWKRACAGLSFNASDWTTKLSLRLLLILSLSCVKFVQIRAIGLAFIESLPAIGVDHRHWCLGQLVSWLFDCTALEHPLDVVQWCRLVFICSRRCTE